VQNKDVLSDDVRTIDVYHVQGMSYALEDTSYTQDNHSEDMLVAYLPKEKILGNADLYTPPAPGAAPPAALNPGTLALDRNNKRLKQEVVLHLRVHGRPGTNDEFVKIVGKPN
jgi:hypothetical protein